MMKLNKYIYAKLEERQIRFLENEPVTEDDIDDWISDWYSDTFQQIGCDGNIEKPRGPPMWLCGPRWYDRRKRMIEEAEAKSYEKDE